MEPFLSTIIPIDGLTHSDRVFEALELEIVSGRLPMGAKLGEEALAARFGMSRGPLREALRRLEGRALVERTAHAGARVVSLAETDLVELYEVREMLEGLAARLAAERMTNEELDSLRQLLQQQADVAGKESDMAYAQGIGDADFHFRIAAGSGSARLQKLLCGDLYSLIRLCRFRTWAIPGERKSQRDHERIFEAICERDGGLAETLMRRHVTAAKNRFLAAEPVSRRSAFAREI
jgi:DNA-binding GntR family transcriptional regulator